MLSAVDNGVLQVSVFIHDPYGYFMPKRGGDFVYPLLLRAKARLTVRVATRIRYDPAYGPMPLTCQILSLELIKNRQQGEAFSGRIPQFSGESTHGVFCLDDRFGSAESKMTVADRRIYRPCVSQFDDSIRVPITLTNTTASPPRIGRAAYRRWPARLK